MRPVFKSELCGALDGLHREFRRNVGLRESLPPDVAVFDTDESVTLEIDLPGIPREYIELLFENGLLTVRAERKASEREARSHDRRRYGRFERVLQVGERIERDGIDATSVDGVLIITLPKVPEEQPAKIAVRGSKAEA